MIVVVEMVCGPSIHTTEVKSFSWAHDQLNTIVPTLLMQLNTIIWVSSGKGDATRNGVCLLGYILKRNKHGLFRPFSFLAGWDVVKAGVTILVLEIKLHVKNERGTVWPPTSVYTLYNTIANLYIESLLCGRHCGSHHLILTTILWGR